MHGTQFESRYVHNQNALNLRYVLTGGTMSLNKQEIVYCNVALETESSNPFKCNLQSLQKMKLSVRITNLTITLCPMIDLWGLLDR